MKLQDLDFKNTVEKSQKVFEGYFNKEVDFTALSAKQAQSMLNRVRAVISEHRNSSRLHTSERDPNYLKLMVMEQALAAKVEENQDLPIDMNNPRVRTAMQKAERQQNLTPDEQKIVGAIATRKNESKKKKYKKNDELLNDSLEESVIAESEVQQAQVVLASQDMTDRLQDMLEDATEMQFKDLPALVESIRNEIGTNQAQQYMNDANSALEKLIACLQESKTEIEGAQGILTGQKPVVPDESSELAPADDQELDLDVDADVEIDDEDDDANSDLERSLGRARR